MKKKSTHIQIRMSIEEKSFLIQKANKFNLGISDYVRNCINQNQLRSVPSDISRAHLSAISEIGNQLNSIVSLLKNNRVEINDDIRNLANRIAELIKKEDSRNDC